VNLATWVNLPQQYWCVVNKVLDRSGSLWTLQ